MPHHHVFRWDLDKTYLATPFESLRGLVRTFFEPAEAKITYPGAAPILRAIARRPHHHLFILSGSPRQMAKVLTSKLALDGVEPEGMTLKPSLEILLSGRFRALREQLGYKLPALLEARILAPHGSAETLVGDDVEIDALIYSIYADLLAGRVGRDLLDELLGQAGSPREIRAKAAGDLEMASAGPGVDRILIHLAKKTPPAELAHYGSRLVAVYNYFQLALLLFRAGRVGPLAVAEAAAEVDAADRGSLPAWAAEFVARGAVGPSDVERWLDMLPEPSDPVAESIRRAVRAAERIPVAPAEAPDYATLYRATREERAADREKAKPMGDLS